jgi:hypothetical protein
VHSYSVSREQVLQFGEGDNGRTSRSYGDLSLADGYLSFLLGSSVGWSFYRRNRPVDE